MTTITRRNFLRTTAASGALLGFAGLVSRYDGFNLFGPDALAQAAPPYGTPSPKAANNTGEFLLSLPAGFQYNVVCRAGNPMTNGQPLPIRPDGMAVIRSSSTPNSWVLIRNHENYNFAGSVGAVTGTVPYDALAAGGTTTLIIDRQTRTMTDSFTSLTGTVWNCSGGPTPWKTWISCEETTVGVLGGYAQPHGYCFEVTPQAPAVPVPLKQMGRFRHEGAAVDKTTGIVYLTEDNNPTAGFYRFLPNRWGILAAGGRLQMLAIPGQPGYDTRVQQTVGQKILATWVDIAEPDSPNTESDPNAVYNQGMSLGGAIFTRLEGCFAELNQIYFTSTNGGNAGLGQVWKYESRKKSKFGYLTLIFESPDAAVLDFPDNLCFGPAGNMFLCEDGTIDNYVRVLTPRGSLSDFAKNIVPGFEATEFAGCCFSPDLQTLFVNIQDAGITLAIWGNW